MYFNHRFAADIVNIHPSGETFDNMMIFNRENNYIKPINWGNNHWNLPDVESEEIHQLITCGMHVEFSHKTSEIHQVFTCCCHGKFIHPTGETFDCMMIFNRKTNYIKQINWWNDHWNSPSVGSIVSGSSPKTMCCWRLSWREQGTFLLYGPWNNELNHC